MSWRIRVSFIPALLASFAIASSAMGDPLTYRTFVGSMNNFNSFGELGFVAYLAKDGEPALGNFGAAFDNIVTVNSITIDQRVDAGRNRMKDLRIYTSPGSFVTTQLADAQGPQTVTLPGAGLASDYFFITIESHYGDTSLDPNPGLHAFTFDGTIGAPRTNLNAFIEPVVTNQFEPENFFLDVLTNGQIVSTTGGPVDYVFFEATDTTDRTITVNYASPQNVASIGLSFEGQIVFSSNSRPVPKFVTITDSSNNSQVVTLAPHTLQYGQHTLTTPITNTTSLKLTLPVGIENYYVPEVLNPSHPLDTFTGVTEFQAFADSLVPPAGDGDFDGDGDVDGRDFLVWQRGGSPTPLSAGDLADWQNNYNAPLSAISAVPEPSTILLALLGVLSCSRRMR